MRSISNGARTSKCASDDEDRVAALSEESKNPRGTPQDPAAHCFETSEFLEFWILGFLNSSLCRSVGVEVNERNWRWVTSPVRQGTGKEWLCAALLKGSFPRAETLAAFPGV